MYGASNHHVVIVGGGFAGLYAAQSLRRAPVRATLIDRRNFHLFQPLLYQVATGGLSPADIASPLRAVLRRQRNVCVLQGEVVGFDTAGHRVLLEDASIEFDTLILATGASHHFFGHRDWESASSRSSRLLPFISYPKRRGGQLHAPGAAVRTGSIGWQ